MKKKKKVLLAGGIGALVLLLVALPAAGYFGYYSPKKAEEREAYKVDVAESIESIDSTLIVISESSAAVSESIVIENIDIVETKDLYSYLDPYSIDATLSSVKSNLETLESDLNTIEDISKISHQDLNEVNESRDLLTAEAMAIQASYNDILDYYELAIPIYKDFELEKEDKPSMVHTDDVNEYRAEVKEDVDRHLVIAETLKSIDAPESLQKEHLGYIVLIEAYAEYLTNTSEETIVLNAERSRIYNKYQPLNTSYKISLYGDEVRPAEKALRATFTSVSTRQVKERPAYLDIIENRTQLF